MLVLTDTGDLEPELDISKKAVQSVGLRGKRFVQENLFAGSFLPGYNRRKVDIDYGTSKRMAHIFRC